MTKSSLIEILRSFDKEELTKFEDFLNSPYHNKNRNTLRLFTVVKKYFPNFKSEELNKEIVWKKLFPDKDYNYGVMKNLIHELSKLCMKFIVLEEFEENILEKDTILMNGLNNRNIAKLFKVKINEIERRNSKESFNNEYFFVNDFYSAMSKISWIKIYHGKANNINAVSTKDLAEGSAMFVYSFLIYLFKYYNNVLSDSLSNNIPVDKNILAVFLKEISPEIIDKLLIIVKDHSKRDFKILNVFWNWCKTQLNPGNASIYQEFKKSFFENINMLSRWDTKDLFILMGNSLSNLDPAETDIEKELFDISKTMLESKIIFNRDGTLTAADFNLYIWRAFNANDYEAIKKFTVTYLNKIPVDKKEYSCKISDAFIFFGEGKFNEALEIISASEHPNFITKVRMKQLKAKCLYELSEQDIFENEFKAMYHFLKNNKSLSNRVKADTKIIFNRINRLFRLKENFDRYEFEKLNKEISGSSLNKASWFNVKIKQLTINN